MDVFVRQDDNVFGLVFDRIDDYLGCCVALSIQEALVTTAPALVGCWIDLYK